MSFSKLVKNIMSASKDKQSISLEIINNDISTIITLTNYFIEIKDNYLFICEYNPFDFSLKFNVDSKIASFNDACGIIYEILSDNMIIRILI